MLELAASLAGAVLVAPASSVSAQPLQVAGLPISGIEQQELVALDVMTAQFMTEQRIPGAALAVTKDRRLVYARGFGLADRDRGQAMQAADLFRIASISKAITAVAVLQLVERRMLELHAKVWELLQLPEPADARWKQITAQNLLQHTGGWDSDKTGFDPMFQSARIARALSQPLPARQEHFIRYMLGQTLQFDPGSQFAYSNFGYCVLGRVIERVTGLSYEAHVRQAVLAPLGIRRMRQGQTLRSGRAPEEVAYYDERSRTAEAVVGPIGERVPLPYGAWSLEAMDANGGWLASAVDLVRFASAFDDPATCPILQPLGIAAMFARPVGPAGIDSGGNHPGSGWFVWPEDRHPHRAHSTTNGLLAGSSTYLMRRRDGVNWAVLFNTANALDGRPLMIKFRDRSTAAFDSVKAWPVADQFASLL